MSLRAELLRLGLRWSKRRASAVPDIGALRERLEAMKRWIPNPPTGTTVTRHDAGGVKAVRVATGASLAGRHILYLHGGAYNFGAPSYYRDFIWRVAAAAPRACCASPIGSLPSILFRRRSTTRSQPIAGFWRKAPRRSKRR